MANLKTEVDACLSGEVSFLHTVAKIALTEKKKCSKESLRNTVNK